LKSEDVTHTTALNNEVTNRVTALSPERLRLLAREIKKRKSILMGSALEEGTPSPLVRIRATGSNPPLFLVHPVGGGVMAYHDLAKYLGDEQPVYALQNHDRSDHDERIPPSIDAMATHYIEVICNVNSSGPYLLGGSSMGGIVAFEMALQLLAKGRQVGLVAMLDSPARITPRQPGAANELIMIAEIIAASSSRKLQFCYGDIEHLAPAERAGYVFHKLQEQDLIPAHLELPAFNSALNTFTNNLNALEKYTPRNYSGKVVVLRATDTSQDMRETAGEVWDDPSFGWQSLCTRPVTVHFVPGTHISMNLEPHVKVVGARLQLSIDQVLQRKAPA
jgi:thioesterase domain-containing protein